MKRQPVSVWPHIWATSSTWFYKTVHITPASTHPWLTNIQPLLLCNSDEHFLKESCVLPRDPTNVQELTAENNVSFKQVSTQSWGANDKQAPKSKVSSQEVSPFSYFFSPPTQTSNIALRHGGIPPFWGV